MKKANSATRRKFLRRTAWAGAAFVIVCLAIWAAREPIAAKLEARLLRELQERGLHLRYAHRSWLPWRGLHFDRLVLHRDATEKEPVIELTGLTVRVPWTEIWEQREFRSRFQTDDATLTLHDATGSIVFEHITADIAQRGPQIEIVKFQARHDAVSCDVTGAVMLKGPAQRKPPSADDPKPAPPRNFAVNLRVVRIVLAWLDFKSGAGPFDIRGTLNMDFQAAPKWRAELRGTGRDVEWRGIPIRTVVADGKISEAGMTITPDVQLAKGSAKVTVSRDGWKGSPILIAGEFADDAGRTDTFSSSYDPPSRTFAIAAVDGAAHLADFATNFPFLLPHLPTGIQVRTFPEIAAKDIRWSVQDLAGTWAMASLQCKTPADITITLGDQPLTIDGAKAQASRSDGRWQMAGTSGRLSWGDWSARSSNVKCELTASDVKFESRFGLAKGVIALDGSTKTQQPAAWNFTGTVADAASNADRLSGQYDARARALSVAKLSGKADLLEIASNFRDLAARLPKGLEVRTFPDLALENFSLKANRWSLGSLQLRSPASLTLAINKRPLAIDQLTGHGAFDGKTWRFSKVSAQSLGGRFALDGAYDDDTLRDATVAVTKVRLKDLSPWTDIPPDSLGGALLSLDYRGALGARPAQLNGAGDVRLENAPIVKVPLLDQTYALFSVIRLGLKRTGTGSLQSTFSVQDGVFTISKLTARSDAIDVTATGTVDLLQREISAQAKGRLRGVAGLATSPVTSMLDMKVSGPIGQVRVQAEGPVRGTGGVVKGAAKMTGGVIKTGVTMPLKVLDWFKGDPPKQP